MTPERIEPIKLAAFTREELVKLIRKQEAALEETQHQLTLERERTEYWGGKEAEAQQTLVNLRAERDGLKEHRSALVISNTELKGQLLQAQQTIARQQEAMDRASDMMNHKHPAYRLLQDAILPAGEDDQP